MSGDSHPQAIRCHWCGAALTAFDLVNIGGRTVPVCKVVSPS